MARYQSTKNKFILVFLWTIVAALLALIIYAVQAGERNLLSLFFVIAVMLLIIWILFDTRYVIKNTIFKYRSGPFRGKIDITSIYKIQTYAGTNAPVTNKPALDNQGLIMHYNSGKHIFVSPTDTKLFIKELTYINQNIELI